MANSRDRELKNKNNIDMSQIFDEKDYEAGKKTTANFEQSGYFDHCNKNFDTRNRTTTTKEKEENLFDSYNEEERSDFYKDDSNN